MSTTEYKSGTCRSCGPTTYYRMASGWWACGSCMQPKDHAPRTIQHEGGYQATDVYCWRCRESTAHDRRGNDNICRMCGASE